MRLKELTLTGFKSFNKKTVLTFDAPITSVVGPNGSGKSNIAEAFRWVLGEQSLKSLRGKRGEDLIFNGGGGGQKVNWASVLLTFDNQDHKFNVDFPELTIGREVHRDGTNVYTINGSEVRLRDVVELLAGATLGASGHTIIRQGEADRILNADIASRREMVEDALGLRLYQWKISESEKKLTKTEENIKQVESLRREIAPHLKFLRREVEKIKKTDELRAELKRLYLVYLKIESGYLKNTRASLNSEKHQLDSDKKTLEIKLGALKHEANPSEEKLKNLRGALIQTANGLRDGREKCSDLERQIGRLEGIIQFKSEIKTSAVLPTENLSRDQVQTLTEEIEQLVEGGFWQKIRELIKDFWQKIDQRERAVGADNHEEELHKFKTEQSDLENKIKLIKNQEADWLKKEGEINLALEQTLALAREADRESYELLARRREEDAKLALWQSRDDKLKIEELAFERELKEGEVLVDKEILNYREAPISSGTNEESRDEQTARLRVIEKLKIRLEDMGVDSGGVLTEHKQVEARDEFLAKELTDLAASRVSLETVIAELRARIDEEFTEGLQKINLNFQKFFTLMFGGGEASLKVLTEPKRVRASSAETDEPTGDNLMIPDEEVEMRSGIEIKINLPKKRIRALEMLSGGERALTSIALLFAMSQVNPPPFLILDETDAALDEANSCKYGDMVESLAKHSQLILITHNRETMSRAQVIYGITMGADGISRLLSIKLDDATAFAK
ncbi:MAG: AAA family ATPase [Patescibacteria group bacterium]